MKYIFFLLLLGTVGSGIGCAHKSHPGPPLPTNRSVTSEYVDLQPGSTVRVVIPVLRSGTYVIPSLRPKATGENRTFEAEAGSDFLGYETDLYTVKQEGKGVRVLFTRAELWQEGRTHRVTAPRVPLFEALAESYVRLVFLTRVSKADHDMAIVSAKDQAILEAITRQVTERADCPSRGDVICRWVPNGIAVTPEWKTQNGNKRR